MSLYDRLGVQRGADSSEIRRAYLKLSKTAHPDKGGSEEEFKKIQQAYEILSDDQKRGFYDQTGQIPGEEEGPGGGGMGPMGGMPFPFPFDLGGMFGGMFGGGGPGGPRPQRVRRPKAPPKVHEIGLTLKDFYYGKKIQLKFERQKFCDACKGKGAERFENCNGCNGSGFREQHIMIGPGMQAVSRGPCGACSGEGKQPAVPCSKCHGGKYSNQEKILHISIEPGMKPGDVMKFANECSDHPDFEEPGDVHIVLREGDENTSFSRSGDDLAVVVNITLMDALLGATRILHGHPAHPEGLTVKVPAGSMRGDVVVVTGEGMPCQGNTRRGNLQMTISLDVKESEKALLEKHKDALRALLV